MEEQEDKLYCPHCGSSQLTANKKGFGAGKAVAGAVLTGGVGLLAGFIGSGNVKITCLKCGCTWKPGQLRTSPLPKSQKQEIYNKPQIKKETEDKPENFGKTLFLLLFSLIIIVASIVICCNL